MTIALEVKTDFVSFHKWPEAPPQVSYLKHLHRHKFYVTLQIEVKHEDRELEFMLVLDALNFHCGQLKNRGSALMDMSCESMAKYLIWAMRQNKAYCGRDISCKVSEDDEVGAIVSVKADEEV